MHTPEEPEYYLRRDFEGAYSLRVVPFLDARCYDGCGNYIIYGHYMKDGTMFGSLQAYAKPAYCEAHPHHYAEYRNRMCGLHGNGGILFTGLQPRG